LLCFALVAVCKQSNLKRGSPETCLILRKSRVLALWYKPDKK